MKRSLLLLPVLVWGCGTDVSGPAAALLTCVYGAGASMDPAEVVQAQGADSQTVCLSPDGADLSEYVYIPFFGTPAPEDDEAEVTLDLELEVTGSWEEAAAVSRATARHGARPAGPLLMRGGGGDEAVDALEPAWTPDHRFHDWLRGKEISELTPRIRGGAASGPSAAASSLASSGSTTATAVPGEGTLLELNVSISCTNADHRTGRVVWVSDHAIVVADTANPASLSSSDYQFLATTFDTLVYPVETAHFGEPGDVDGNDRTILFFTSAVNELTSRDSNTITLGFFWSGDLFPEESTPRLEACPAANQAEIVYLLAPDPDARVGPKVELEVLLARAVPLLGHEFQHLVNASRRLFVNEASTFEDPWLNEGLSHVAEELLFFAASVLEPGSNLSAADLDAAGAVPAFNRYMGGNLGNFREYLEKPDTASLMGIDALTTRGASWSFLRYAADRSGRGDEAFFFDVVNGQRAGLENLDRVIGGDGALSWMQDWTVSVYADDFVPGIAARYTQPSWNLRTIYPRTNVGEYPLLVITLTANDPVRVELLPGGAAFTRFTIRGGEQAVLRAESDGTPPSSAVRSSLMRVR